MEKQNFKEQEDIFIKKYWPEDDILFYIQFQNGVAIKQIEIQNKKVLKLSIDKPFMGDSLLYDQKIDDLDLVKKDFISSEEFKNKWESIND